MFHKPGNLKEGADWSMCPPRPDVTAAHLVARACCRPFRRVTCAQFQVPLSGFQSSHTTFSDDRIAVCKVSHGFMCDWKRRCMETRSNMQLKAAWGDRALVHFWRIKYHGKEVCSNSDRVGMLQWSPADKCATHPQTVREFHQGILLSLTVTNLGLHWEAVLRPCT